MKPLLQMILKAVFLTGLAALFVSNSIFAQEMNFNLSLNSTTPIQGQELRLSVSTDNSDGLYYFGFEVTYDQYAFEFVGVEPGEIMNPNPLSVGGSLATDRVGASVVRTSDVATGEGQVMELTFIIKDDAEPGDFEFLISAADARSNTGTLLDLIIPSAIPFEVLDKNILRDVTFSVNMNAQIENGTFQPGVGDKVYVRGGFNDWFANAASEMTDNGDGIYEITVSIAGNAGSNIQYKFFMGAGDNRPLPNTGWEGSVGTGPDGNRVLTLGPENVPQTLPTVFFNNVALDTPTRNVTFSVDMNAQITNGNFNPAVDQVRVNGGFSGWESIVMTESETSGIYTHTANVTGNEGVVVEYKFMINNEFEGAVGAGNNGNRQFTLGPGSTPQILPTVFFNNQEPTEPTDPEITFANLQFPPTAEIALGGSADVYAQVTVTGLTPGVSGYQGLTVWVGVSSDNSDPSTWENWIEASYIGISGFTSRAEYLSQIGADITEEGTFYYATRFQLEDGEFVFGGFSEVGGGFWDGTTNVSGVLTVTGDDPVDPEITFANLQFPSTAEIEIGGSADVYAQVTIAGLTPSEEGYDGLQVWVGVSSENTNPSTWDNWSLASFFGISGFTSRAEYLAQIGSDITEEGIYYFATRFQLGEGDFVFGGYSEDGGGFWDGETNVSGVLTVSDEVVAPDSRTVVFSVDMSVQIALGNFDPTTDAAGVSGSFNGWEISLLAANTENPELFEAEILVAGEEGETVDFKFRINDEFEQIGDDPLQNRQFTLSEPDVLQVLETVFYGDIDEVPGPARLNIAAWNFEDADKRALYTAGASLTYTADDGSEANKDIAQINLNGSASFSGWVLGATGSGTFAANSNNWNDGAGTKYWSVSISTVGFEDIQVSSRQQSSNTGPRDFKVQYRVGNTGDWNDVADGSITVANNFTVGVVDGISLPEDANNQNTVQLRWLMTSNTSVANGTVANNGTNRIDEIFITGIESDGPAPGAEITFANLQFPGETTIELGGSVSVFGQVLVTGGSLGETGYSDLQVWVGYNVSNSNPSDWTVWVPATYNGVSEFGDRPEYTASIGADISEAGTYYFATRFQLGSGAFVFGGFSETGGGFWNGESNRSGVLTVTSDTDPEIVVVWPGDTNNDGVVDALDVLAIGSFFSTTGPARASQGTTWAGAPAEIWEPLAATYADTDGSGLVNQTDLLAVGLNFGETHEGGTALSTQSFTFNLPAIGIGQFLKIDLSVLEDIAIQGVGFMIRVEGLTAADASIQDMEPGLWAADWEASNSLISFERVEGLELGLAYIHRGNIAPVSANVLTTFNIMALSQWPLGATLVIDRVVYVNSNNQQVAFDNIDADISIQGGVNINNPELPIEMALHRNYPNPFNPTTNIVFDVSEHTAVTIEVMNILGQRVAVLANNEELAPGQYIRVFDAGRLTSGVYLVRMTAGTQAFTQKIMLVK